MNTFKTMRLKTLVFKGQAADLAKLDFSKGLNLIWGASNTGKSFAFHAIDFMLGSSTPPAPIDELLPYSVAFLGFEFSDGLSFTFSRSVKGGEFKLHSGIVEDETIDVIEVLGAKHEKDNQKTVSGFLLSALGLEQKLIAKNAFGLTNELSFRQISDLILGDESAIQAERSPIVSGNVTSKTSEESAFRLLLSGLDDSSINSGASPRDVSKIKAHKLEVVNQLIGETQNELQTLHPQFSDYADQERKLAETLKTYETEFDNARKSVADKLDRKQTATSSLTDAKARYAEIEIHLARFSKLDEIYQSDIERLKSIEETSFLVSLISQQACSRCGAEPEFQKFKEAGVSSQRSALAAAAEIQKTRKLQKDLEATVKELNLELNSLTSAVTSASKTLRAVEAEISSLFPKIDTNRAKLTDLRSQREKILLGNEIANRLKLFESRRTQIESEKGMQKKEQPNLGLSSQLAGAFAKEVSNVLKVWNFPGKCVVDFDQQKFDIRIDGKSRAHNGKGVRAITHSAFKIALLTFCRKNNLPHPGFVVLDTPLLTYRDPLKNPRAGVLAPDEKAIKQSSLKDRFFEHLHSLASEGQFIIFENVEPPGQIESLATVTVFTGNAAGRYGFFPSKK